MNVDMTPDGKATVRLEGDMNISRAAEMKEALVSAFELAPNVVVDFEKVETVDLSCLQLICAAHRSALKKNGSLGVTPGSLRLLKDARIPSGPP